MTFKYISIISYHKSIFCIYFYLKYFWVSRYSKIFPIRIFHVFIAIFILQFLFRLIYRLIYRLID